MNDGAPQIILPVSVACSPSSHISQWWQFCGKNNRESLSHFIGNGWSTQLEFFVPLHSDFGLAVHHQRSSEFGHDRISAAQLAVDSLFHHPRESFGWCQWQQQHTSKPSGNTSSYQHGQHFVLPQHQKTSFRSSTPSSISQQLVDVLLVSSTAFQSSPPLHGFQLWCSTFFPLFGGLVQAARKHCF